MRTRQGTDGLDELEEAARAVGLVVERPPAGEGGDLTLVNPAGGRFSTWVKRVSLASTEHLARRVREWHADAGDRHDLRVVVADRVTEQARHLLRRDGWGWLDLRGHLHLAGAGIFVDAALPAFTTPAVRTALVTGRVGPEVAALLLLDPAKPASVREIARSLGRSPSSVSQALAGIREAGLADDERRPVVPDLFWALADHWASAPAGLARLPSPGDSTVTEALRLGVAQPDAAGWALTDSVAAAAYGAPIGIRSDHPPDFHVPDQATFRRAVTLLGPASSHDSRAATIRVAPIPAVTSRRIVQPGSPWPLARPLFVALDLAQDPGRGREVLAGWTPSSEAGTRVW